MQLQTELTLGDSENVKLWQSRWSLKYIEPNNFFQFLFFQVLVKHSCEHTMYISRPDSESYKLTELPHIISTSRPHGKARLFFRIALFFETDY